eukprot:Hpha_TRINITY_DN11650_c0_g1::TRINITY_DN11650_c0_g1_i1::g.49324::m.49324
MGGMDGEQDDVFLDCNSPPLSPRDVEYSSIDECTGPKAVEAALLFLYEHKNVIVASYFAPSVFEDFLDSHLEDRDCLAMRQLMRGVGSSLSPDERGSFGEVILGRKKEGFDAQGAAVQVSDPTHGGGLIEGETRLLRQFLNRNWKLAEYLALASRDPFTLVALNAATQGWDQLHPWTDPSETEMRVRAESMNERGRVRFVQGRPRVRGSCVPAIVRNHPDCPEIRALVALYDALLRAASLPGQLSRKIAVPILSLVGGIDPRNPPDRLLLLAVSRAGPGRIDFKLYSEGRVDLSGQEMDLLQELRQAAHVAQVLVNERLVEMVVQGEQKVREEIDHEAATGWQCLLQLFAEKSREVTVFVDCDDGTGSESSGPGPTFRVVGDPTTEATGSFDSNASSESAPSAADCALLQWCDEHCTLLLAAVARPFELSELASRLPGREPQDIRMLIADMEMGLPEPHRGSFLDALHACDEVDSSSRLVQPQGDLALEHAQELMLSVLRECTPLVERLTIIAMNPLTSVALLDASRLWQQHHPRRRRDRASSGGHTRQPQPASHFHLGVARASPPPNPDLETEPLFFSQDSADLGPHPHGRSLWGRLRTTFSNRSRNGSLWRRAAAAVLEPPAPP